MALPTGTVGFVCAEPEVAVPFADLLHEGVPTEPTVLDVVVERVASGDLALHIDGEPLLVSGKVADIIDGIVGVLNRAVLDHGPDSLHIHGAVVELGGVGHLLAGPSGSGKTTLAAALLGLRARYLTDEICTVDPDAASIPAYPKPLTLKPGWSPTPDPIELSDAGRGALAASRLASVATSTVVGNIWWVTYRPGGHGTTVTDLARVTACRHLLGDSLDAARLGPEALDVLAPLVARSTCWSIEYGEVRDAAGVVAGSAATNGCGFELLHLGDEFGPCWRVATFDDGALLLDWPSRMVVELSDHELSAIGDLVDGTVRGADRRLDRLAGFGILPPDRDGGAIGHRWRFDLDDPIDPDVGDVVAALRACGAALVPTTGPSAASGRPATGVRRAPVGVARRAADRRRPGLRRRRATGWIDAPSPRRPPHRHRRAHPGGSPTVRSEPRSRGDGAPSAGRSDPRGRRSRPAPRRRVPPQLRDRRDRDPSGHPPARAGRAHRTAHPSRRMGCIAPRRRSVQRRGRSGVPPRPSRRLRGARRPRPVPGPRTTPCEPRRSAWRSSHSVRSASIDSRSSSTSSAR